MAITYRDITLKNTEKLDKKQDKRNAFRAVITDNLGNQSGSGSIWADQSARRIWVMPIGGVQPFQIICVKITPVIGLGVICGYSDDFSTLLEVLRTDYEFLGPSNTTGTAYESPSNLDFLPGGRLQLWIDGRMIQPLATYPDTTGLLVNVVNGEYIYGGVRVTFDGEEGIDLTSSVPGTPNQHRYVGLYLDSANTIQIVDGTAVSTANTAPEPTWPAGAFELSMVLLANGQTDIDMTDIANKRIFSTDITSFAAGGWPFSQVLTVSTTDLDADFDNLPDAITAASAGDTILLDSETFTISGSALSVSKALTIAGQSQAQTIITSALSNSPSIDVATDNMTFKNLTIQHTGTGTTAGPLSTDNADLVLDNVYLDKTSGAATTGYGLWMYGGSVTLKNGTRISTTAGTTKYGIYNDSADATITIFGGQVGGDTQDIYTARAGSTLNLYEPVLTNNLLSWAGTRQGVYQISNGSLVAAGLTPIIWTNPAFSVNKNGTDQTITHNTLTKLTWSAESYDTHGWFASDKYTPLLAGKYLLKLKIYWLAGADQVQFYAVIYKNGAYTSDFIVNGSGTNGFTVAATAILDANGSTDYFEAYAYQSSGSDKTVYGSAGSTNFEGIYLGR